MFKGKIIVISSVSGGGKTSIIGEIKKRYPGLSSAITATSRKPRNGEVDGIDYIFLEAEEFRRRIEAGEFLEYATVHENFYGVPATPQIEKLNRGISVILNIDVQGKKNVEKQMKDRMISIFILPPDRETWERRLRGRGTDSEEIIRKRLEEGERELKHAEEYDYRVRNDLLDRAVEEVCRILKERGAV